MRRGRPVPPAIVRFILETKTNAPQLTQAEVADRVAGQFGESVDKSTVSRTLRRAGWTRTLARPADRREQAEQAFMRLAWPRPVGKVVRLPGVRWGGF